MRERNEFILASETGIGPLIPAHHTCNGCLMVFAAPVVPNGGVICMGTVVDAHVALSWDGFDGPSSPEPYQETPPERR